MSLYTLLLLVGGFIFIAALVGFSSGLLGIGGGIIMVPVFQFVFPLLHTPLKDSIIMASATSLCIAMFSSTRAMLSHHRNKNIHWHMLTFLVPSLLIGAQIGSSLAIFATPLALHIIFIVVFSYLSFNLWFGTGKPLLKNTPPNWVNIFIGLLVGCIASILGIGGGVLAVPIFTYLNYSIHKAIGNASVIVFSVASSSTIGYFLHSLHTNPTTPPYTLGYVFLLAVVVFIPVTIVFVPIGIRIGQKTSQKNLRKYFSIFLGLLVLYKLTIIFF